MFFYLNLQSADLTNANLEGANLEGANLKVKAFWHCLNPKILYGEDIMSRTLGLRVADERKCRGILVVLTYQILPLHLNMFGY